MIRKLTVLTFLKLKHSCETNSTWSSNFLEQISCFRSQIAWSMNNLSIRYFKETLVNNLVRERLLESKHFLTSFSGTESEFNV